MTQPNLEEMIRERLKEYAKDRLDHWDQTTANGILDLSDQTDLWYAMPQQGEDYTTITSSPSFQGLDKVVTEYKKLSKAKKRSKIGVVDYGSGNGLKGIHVAEQWGLENLEKLIFVDNSNILLYIASQNALLANIPSLQYPTNLAQMWNVFKNWYAGYHKTTKLHLFLGHTMGNFADPKDIAARIASNMQTGECLIVEWLGRDRKAHYETDGVQQFHRNYLEEMGFPASSIGEYSVGEDESWYEMRFTTAEEIRSHHKTIPKSTVVVAGRSRRFSEKEVIQLVESADLEGLVLKRWESFAVPPSGYTSSGLIRAEHKQKWEEDGNKRYALFKKKWWTRTKSYVTATVAALLAAGLVGSFAADHYAREDTEYPQCVAAKFDSEHQWSIDCSIEDRNSKQPVPKTVELGYVSLQGKPNDKTVKIKTDERQGYTLVFERPEQLKTFLQKNMISQVAEVIANAPKDEISNWCTPPKYIDMDTYHCDRFFDYLRGRDPKIGEFVEANPQIFRHNYHYAALTFVEVAATKSKHALVELMKVFDEYTLGVDALERLHLTNTEESLNEGRVVDYQHFICDEEVLKYRGRLNKEVIDMILDTASTTSSGQRATDILKLLRNKTVHNLIFSSLTSHGPTSDLTEILKVVFKTSNPELIKRAVDLAEYFVQNGDFRSCSMHTGTEGIVINPQCRGEYSLESIGIVAQQLEPPIGIRFLRLADKLKDSENADQILYQLAETAQGEGFYENGVGLDPIPEGSIEFNHVLDAVETYITDEALLRRITAIQDYLSQGYIKGGNYSRAVEFSEALAQDCVYETIASMKPKRQERYFKKMIEKVVAHELFGVAHMPQKMYELGLCQLKR